MISRMRGSAVRAIAASAAAVTSCSCSMIMSYPVIPGPCAASNPESRGSGFALRAPRNDILIQRLDRQRDALADADAHGGERELAATLLQAVHRRHREPRAAHAERMTECDRAA